MMNKKTKIIIMFISLILVITASVGGTYALLSSSATPQKNVFIPADISCCITGEESEYTVKNIGNVDAYVRVAIIPNWQKNGNIYALKPISDSDYSIVADGWELIDGYFYHSIPIAPGESTSPISIELLASPPDECEFVPEILAESIQSQPADAAKEAWNYPFD
ncbi:MAG: hypothetical protein IKJ91_04990 [Clostridia bacterium]|nr:hypothetical protein [Clostridia bacterium]